MSIRKYFHFRNFRGLQPVDKIITIFSYVPVLCYLLVALLLSVLALFSLINAGNLIFHVIGNMEGITVGAYQAFEMYHTIHAILLTVIIIELFETVTITCVQNKFQYSYLFSKEIAEMMVLELVKRCCWIERAQGKVRELQQISGEHFIIFSV